MNDYKIEYNQIQLNWDTQELANQVEKAFINLKSDLHNEVYADNDEYFEHMGQMIADSF